MNYQTNIRQMHEKTTRAVESRTHPVSGATTRGCKAGSLRPRLNRHIDRESLLVEMLPLVRRIAHHIRGRLPAHVEVHDLMADGVLGLVDALAKFDPSKGVKLESYARHRVRGAILDGLRHADPASRDLRRKNKGIHAAYHELENKLGRSVLDEEMAAALRLNLGGWHQALNEIQSMGLDCGSRVLSAGPTKTLPSADPELLIDGRDSPFDLSYRREQREILAKALSFLRGREREIITLHDQHGLTMKQIAARMRVDESRISQIHSAALARLKASVDSLLHPRPAEASKPHPLAMAAGAGA